MQVGWQAQAFLCQLPWPGTWNLFDSEDMDRLMEQLMINLVGNVFIAIWVWVVVTTSGRNHAEMIGLSWRPSLILSWWCIMMTTREETTQVFSKGRQRHQTDYRILCSREGQLIVWKYWRNKDCNLHANLFNYKLVVHSLRWKLRTKSRICIARTFIMSWQSAWERKSLSGQVSQQHPLVRSWLQRI